MLKNEELIDNFYLEFSLPNDSNGISSYVISNDTQDSLKNGNISTWTMSGNDTEVYYFSNGLYKKNVYDNESINPVINLNKCVLENGCYEEEVVIGCQDENGNLIPFETEENVEVASTLSTISKISMLISFLLIISGIILIIHNYKHKFFVKK